jgi:hypothetical protein
MAPSERPEFHPPLDFGSKTSKVIVRFPTQHQNTAASSAKNKSF